MRYGLLLMVLFFSIAACATDKRPETANKDSRGSIKAELVQIRKTVEKEFNYEFPETSNDLVAVKRAVFLLAKTNGHIKKSEKVRVHWKKTMMKNGNTLEKGYIFLAGNNLGKMGEFGSFWSGTKKMTVDDFGMYGYLKIKDGQAECEDCQGGLWSQNYIQEAAEELLKRGKFFDMELTK